MNLSTKSFNKLKLLIIAIIISSLIATGGALLYKHEQESIRTEKYNELKAIAELKTNQLAQWKKERLSEATFFSTNQPLIQSVTKLKHGDSKSIEYINTSLSHILSYNRYDNIFILNRNGEIIFNLDSTFVEVDSFTISKSNQTITKNEIVFTDFYKCNIHNSVHFDIIAPIQNTYGEVFATLVFRVKPADYLFPLIQYWPTPSKTAESILLKKEDNKAVFINSLRHIDDAPLTQLENP